MRRVDLRFQVKGKQIPVDHGYDLFSSISRIVPEFHQADNAGLKLIRGQYIGEGLLALQTGSCLVLRLDPESLAPYINLAGNTLDIRGYPIQIGVPKTVALIPALALYTHLATTKNGNDQDRFLAEINRQLSEMGVKAEVRLGDRKTFTIHNKKVVGYSMRLLGLSYEDSIKVQEEGLGGRRKMGCGFFEPAVGDQ